MRMRLCVCVSTHVHMHVCVCVCVCTLCACVYGCMQGIIRISLFVARQPSLSPHHPFHSLPLCPSVPPFLPPSLSVQWQPHCPRERGFGESVALPLQSYQSTAAGVSPLCPVTWLALRLSLYLPSPLSPSSVGSQQGVVAPRWLNFERTPLVFVCFLIYHPPGVTLKGLLRAVFTGRD